MTVRRALIIGLAAASAVFIALQLADGWSRISGSPLPGSLPIAGAVVLLGLGQLAIGEAMVALGAGSGTPGDRRWAFHVTQPAKYVPMGVAHAAGVVTALVSRGIPRLPAGVLWAVHTGSLVVVGVSLGLFGSSSFGWPTAIAFLGICVPVCLDRHVLTFVLAQAGRFADVLKRPTLVPPQGQLTRCGVLAAAGVLLHGLAYALLVDASGIDDTPAAAVAAYCLALGVSIATPLPGGLGAREAILLALSSAPAGEALVPIVLVRLLLVGVELVFWLVASSRRPGSSTDSAITPTQRP